MNDAQFAEIAAWLSTAGLKGEDEGAMVTEFCARVVALGLPLARVQVFIDTLHPVHGGQLCSWRAADGKTDVREYQQPSEAEALQRWERSPFSRLLQTGESLLRRRLTG